MDDSVLTQLLPRTPSRAEKRTGQIIQAAIHCYATYGLEGTTFERIAKSAKTSRQLVNHYFKKKDEMLELSLKYIRLTLQKMVVEGLESGKTPKSRFAGYVRAHFEWLKRFPDQASVWALLIYCSSLSKSGKKWRDLNDQVVEMGHQRITAMIEMGVSEGAFRCSTPSKTAKNIQVFLTGALISAATENRSGGLEKWIKRATEFTLDQLE